MNAYLHVVAPWTPCSQLGDKRHSPRPETLPKAQIGSGDSCQSSQETTMLTRNKDYSIKTMCAAGTGMPTHAAVGRQVKTANPTFTPTPAKETISVAIWNVRRLLRPESKPLLAGSLCNRGVTVACLQETRLPIDDACVIQDSNGMPSYKLFTSGEEKYGLHGVGIAIQLKLANCVMFWRPLVPSPAMPFETLSKTISHLSYLRLPLTHKSMRPSRRPPPD